LVEHFLNHFCHRHRRSEKEVTDDAMRVLTAASWPGNVRQLRNVMERLVVTIRGDTVGAENLPTELQPLGPVESNEIRSLAEVSEEAEKNAIQAALAVSDFHRDQTAKALGISIRTLHYKMSRYGLH
jgi:two-component system NtrC family response regulator